MRIGADYQPLFWCLRRSPELLPMINGMHQAARSAGVPLIVIQQALGDLQLPTYGSDHVAGWIIIHPNESDHANLAALCAAGTPVVMVPVPVEGLPCTLVQVDNRGGMRAAVLHLLDHGHQRIAYVDHGPHTWSEQRYQGYCDALDARGIAHDPALIIRMICPALTMPIFILNVANMLHNICWNAGCPALRWPPAPIPARSSRCRSSRRLDTVFPKIWQSSASTIFLRRSMPARRLQLCAASSTRSAAPPPRSC